MHSEAARNLLASLHTLYPICLLLLSALVSLADISLVTHKRRKNTNQDAEDGESAPFTRTKKSVNVSQMNGVSSVPDRCFLGLSAGVLVSYLAEVILYIAHVIDAWSEQWWGGQSAVIYLVGSVSIYADVLMSLLDKKRPKTPHFVLWTSAFAFEIAIFGISLRLYTSPHRESVIGDLNGGLTRLGITIWESIEMTLEGFRILILLVLTLLYIASDIRLRRSYGTPNATLNTSTETTRLLAEDDENRNSNEHDSIDRIDNVNSQMPTPAPTGSWLKYFNDYSLLLPFMWPTKSGRLQLLVVFCFILVILQRIVNILVPAQLGAIVTALVNQQEKNAFAVPWLQVCLLMLCRWLQTNLGSLRSALWIPMTDYSYMELSTATFEHVHCLGLDFHLNKKKGEIVSALSNGHSVTRFLEQVGFQFVPTVVDLVLAIGYFVVKFDVYHALVVIVFSHVYCRLTTHMAQWGNKSSREMNNAWTHEEATKTESISSYEVVQHFNAKLHEVQRYSRAVEDYLRSRLHSSLARTALQVVQSSNFEFCVLCLSFIATYQISAGMRPMGHFVSVLTYTAQLQGPLDYIGTFYTGIQFSMISAERLLDLMKTQPTIRDSPCAVSLPLCKGKIEFNNVAFAYDDRQPVLRNVTFTCEPTTTVALVGRSGGGKSTIIQLLFRFFEPNEGEILVDKHNIKAVKIESLRSHMSVVSQDLSLWNESIEYNLRYAKPHATNEELVKACDAANIHDTIMGFSDGYKTVVGDRGKRLSGGEKQRLAIARAFLRDSPILLLDEATAALDSETEQRIQSSLDLLCNGRTVLMIAHRLSTVMSADRILVINQGQVVESGTHQELLSRHGRYYKMWEAHSGVCTDLQQQDES